MALLDSARGFPRAYWFLWLGTLINRVGGLVVPFLAFYLTGERGFSFEEAGVVASLFGLGSLGAGPIGGVLADRFGRRITMVLGLALGALAMLHLGLARSLWHIQLAAFLLGGLGDLYRPAVWAAVSDLVPAKDRTRAFGLLYWAINLGFAAASLLAGALASGGFWILFAGDAITSLAMAVVVYLAVPETRPPRSRVREASAAADAMAPFRDGVFLSFAGVSFLLAFLFLQHLTALPLDLRAHGFAASTYGALIAINGILIVLLQPFAVRVVQGRRRSRVLSLGAALVGIGFGLTAVARTWPLYALSIALWTLGEILLSPVTPTIVADLAPPELRGTYPGVQQMTWGAAFCLAPAMGSWVLARLGSTALWVGCLVVGLFAAVAHLLIAGARGRRLRELGGANLGGD